MVEIALAEINTFGKASPKAEFESLFSTALEIINAEPDPRDLEITRLREENHRLKATDSKKLFETFELIATGVLAPLLEHEAIDEEAREIVRDLRAVPDELRSYLNKGTKDYFAAIEELTPLVDAAKTKLLEGRKPSTAETKEEHRAKLLLEKLKLWKILRIAKAVDIIDGDEGTKPTYAAARRAMKRAAMLSQDVVFINGYNDGLGAVLKLGKEGAAWFE